MTMVSTCVIQWVIRTAIGTVGQAATEEPGLFSGSWADAVWTVAAFLILLAVLGKVAWKPMLGQLKAREDHIRQQIEAAGRSRRQAEQLLEAHKNQGLQIIKEALDDAHRFQQELLERAQQEVLAVKQKALQDIDGAKTRAEEHLWKEAEHLVLTLSKEVLGREVTPQDHEGLLRQAIDQIKKPSEDKT